MPQATGQHDETPFVDLTITATSARATVRHTHAARSCDGHFPRDPLLPGAFVAGLLAQVGARLVAPSDERPAALAEVVQCVFRHRIHPDDHIVVVATCDADHQTVEAEVHTERGIAARATLRFGTPS